MNKNINWLKYFEIKNMNFDMNQSSNWSFKLMNLFIVSKKSSFALCSDFVNTYTSYAPIIVSQF